MQSQKFKEFVKLAAFFYQSVGIEPYERLDGKRQPLAVDIIFYVGLINMNANLLGEFVFATLAFMRGDFVDATMTLSYIGFVFMGDFKMLYVWWNKRELTHFVNQLYAIFPRNTEQARRYELERYLRKCTVITIVFSLLYMMLIWTYNLFAMMQYLIYDRWLEVREIGQNLPYLVYIPWEWRGNWSYYVLYASQAIAGYTSAAGQIANDLLLCASATQVIMHYDYVAKAIEEYPPQQLAAKDMTFLTELIAYHDKILNISQLMNEVFGIPLLLNFATSSFVICFVGFQMTIGVAPDTLLKLFLFLFCSMAQVYLICYYGQELIDASENIALAAYKHNWQNADVKYQKMLVLVIQRAQKPAVLKATQFLSVSRNSMTSLMQLSYKFFALLRTLYTE